MVISYRVLSKSNFLWDKLPSCKSLPPWIKANNPTAPVPTTSTPKQSPHHQVPSLFSQWFGSSSTQRAKLFCLSVTDPAFGDKDPSLLIPQYLGLRISVEISTTTHGTPADAWKGWLETELGWTATCKRLTGKTWAGSAKLRHSWTGRRQNIFQLAHHIKVWLLAEGQDASQKTESLGHRWILKSAVFCSIYCLSCKKDLQITHLIINIDLIGKKSLCLAWLKLVLFVYRSTSLFSKCNKSFNKSTNHTQTFPLELSINFSQAKPFFIYCITFLGGKYI